ncbi:hypothetical protein BGZ61DRAFT_474865 [Ilyonectria robusta]|uniref:uncharacterized protein n=1 Tax=Ilyonectria robusta TaxID=1079257 RepID=UPI001E8D7C33|nr:uncharacterized protein BGZ61DRAFT_474865 [Ilyonectria robusta]KAH8729207.1 hypothetical protein BGZ61DRAFT_474865 [Ilyonectria robusta]
MAVPSFRSITHQAILLLANWSNSFETVADLGVEYLPKMMAFTGPWEAHVSALHGFCHAFNDLGTMWDPVSGLHLDHYDWNRREFNESSKPSLKLAREARDKNKISIDIMAICHNGVLKDLKELKNTCGDAHEYTASLKWVQFQRDRNAPGYRPIRMDGLARLISDFCKDGEGAIRGANAAVARMDKLIQDLDFVTNIVTWMLRDFRRPPQRSIWSIAYCVLPFTNSWELDSYCKVEDKKGRGAASARLLASHVQGSNGSLGKLRQDLIAKVKMLSAYVAARQELLDEMKGLRDEAILLWPKISKARPMDHVCNDL